MRALALRDSFLLFLAVFIFRPPSFAGYSIWVQTEAAARAIEGFNGIRKSR
jgi:hypothetical protein